MTMIYDEMVLWELTLISLLIGVFIGAVGTILGMKIKEQINILAEKAKKYDEIEKAKAGEIAKTHEEP